HAAQVLRRGGAALVVDVHAVGLVLYQLQLYIEAAEYGGGGAAGGAVGAVDYDFESLYLTIGAAHYMLYVSADHLLAVAADVAYAVVGLERKLLGVVDVVLYLVLYIVRELEAVGVEYLYAVVLIRVVRGGDDDARVG